MNRSRIVIYGAVGFAVGIFVQSAYDLPGIVAYTAAAVAILIVVIQRRFYIAVVILAVGLGMLRVQWSIQPNEFATQFDIKQQLEATVVADPDSRPDKQLLTVQPRGFHQKLIITTAQYGHYFYGDRLLLTGKIKQPKADAKFDYRAYLQRFDIYGQMSYPKIIVLRTNQGNKIMWGLLKIKHAFIIQTEKVLPQTESNLLLGILIGARKGLPLAVINNFNATGVSHIIAISGYNISIIAASLEFLYPLIGRRVGFWVILTVIVAFVFMSGASASVIRAAIMGGLVLLAGRSGRLYTITLSLCVAALLMMVVNPRIIYWDASFQLSFLATAGVVFGTPLLEELTSAWPTLWGIKNILLTTMAAIIATLPLIMHEFGRLSLIAPVVNILMLPLVPLTMLLGALCGLPGINSGFGLPTHWLLSYMLHLTSYFAHLRYASVTVTSGTALTAVLYGVIIFVYIILRRILARSTIRRQKNMVQ